MDMGHFLRIGLNLLLWFFYFWMEKNWSDPILFTLCATVTGLHFLLPVLPRPLPCYFLIQLLLSGLLALKSGAFLPVFILIAGFISIEAIGKINEQNFRRYAIFSMIAEGAALFPLDRMDALWCGFILLFYSTAILANSAHTEMTRFREMYEALKGDYRRLKRYARLTEEEARNEERTKIARDIHDSVGHKLTALLMQMELASLKYGKEAFAPLKKLAKESLEETRAAVKALKAEEVEGISTILQLIKKLESESHIHVHFTTKQGILSTKLTNEESVVLYRVIQEGLTNAMRHAHVREVHVELGRTAVGHIEFQIKNRIPRKTVFSEGFGIRNIRERVEKLGGELYAYQTETHFHLKGHFPPANGVKGRVEPVNC